MAILMTEPGTGAPGGMRDRAAPGAGDAPDVAVGRYVVLGLGNRIQGDEALGALVVEMLARSDGPLAALPDAAAVEAIDGGTVGLALLPLIEDLDGLVVVDLIDGGEEPGTLQDLDGKLLLRRDIVMGVHDLGATELLATLQLMGSMPRRVRVVGIQPMRISLGTELTPEVDATVPALVDAVVAHLRSWQLEDGSDG
jgi:hydrogenase maturation protease